MKQSEAVYYNFKDALLNGKIQLGDTITQAELAKTLQTQISPLRVAMHKLEAEGLVDILPRSGIKIVRPDLDLIRNSYHLRKIVEREGIKVFAQYAADATIQHLIRINEALLEEIGRNDDGQAVLRSFSKVDKATHSAIIEILNNPLVNQVYDTNYDKIRLIRLERPINVSPMDIKASIEEHLTFVRAVQKRDVDGAINSLEEHLDTSLKRAMGIF